MSLAEPRRSEGDGHLPYTWRSNMQTRQLGNSELEISRIGLGAWAIGGAWEWGWGQQEDAASIRTIHRALERGINWIDTAPVYGLGHSEEVVAQALKGLAARPYVFTKCGLVWNDQGHTSHRLQRASIEREVDNSLRRLNVDVIDLYQIHWPSPDEDIEQATETLAEIQSRGKVRYLGVSNFSVEQLERVRPLAEIVSLQPPYSLIVPEASEEILPYCVEHGIGAINYSPMASGLLSGKMTRERLQTLPDDDWRKKNKRFREPQLSRHLKLAALLAKFGDRRGHTAGEMAIAWTLQHPGITGAIVGLRSPEQVDGVIQAAEVELGVDENRSIDAFLGRRAGG